MAGRRSRKLNGQMCWLWCGGMNPTHRCCLDLSALQRNRAHVFSARSTEGGPCVGTVPGKYSCAGPFVNAVIFPVTWGTRNPAEIWGKLRWWQFLAGPFAHHHSSIALFSFLPSLGLPETRRHSCVCMNLWGGKKKVIKSFHCYGFWLLAGAEARDAFRTI